MLSLQIVALTLIPLLSGVMPTESGVSGGPRALLGIEERVTPEFMVGTWTCSEDFFRWGITDRNRATVKPLRGRCYMSLGADGIFEMVNLFQPSEGRWELTERGLVIYDPNFPQRGSQVLPVRRRGNDSIWLLLPFTGGATGIGLTRVTEKGLLGTEAQEDLVSAEVKGKRAPRKSRAAQQGTGSFGIREVDPEGKMTFEPEGPNEGGPRSSDGL